MYENRLTIDPAEFKAALRLFARKGFKLGQVMLAFEGGFPEMQAVSRLCLGDRMKLWLERDGGVPW
jgi:hypothetical protein